MRKYNQFVERRKKQIEYEKRIEASAKYITRTRELEKEKLTMINIERHKAKEE